MKRRTALLCTAALLCVAGVQAQGAYPNRPVKLIIPATPGGPSDLVGRIVGQKLGEMWGQSVIVENRPGGAQMIAASAVVKAPPDGYTLLQGTSNMATNPIFNPKMPYDTLKDFVAVTRTHATPMVLVVNKDVPVKTTAELITYIKQNPGKLSFATSGQGSSQQLAMMQLVQATGLPSMTEIPYQGSSQAHPDLIAGRVAMMIDPAAAVTSHIKAGSLRALAVTTPERLAMLPDIPTLAETGFANVDLTGWGGIFAPAATPPEVLAKLNADLKTVLASSDVRERFARIGLVARSSSPEEFQAFVKAETERWAKVVAAAK